MPTTEPFGLPPADAVDWFEDKGNKLGFDWRDVWGEQHSWAFTVAKAMQLDVLGDLREAIDQAIKDGISLAEFQKRLRPLLQSKGWWGIKEQVDPVTGEVKEVQLGSPRRLRIIYDTNLRQAHAAGRWRRIERNASKRPYVRYIARQGGKNRRAEHQAWHNKVFPVNSPTLRTIFPMNGWGCQCGTQQLSERQVKALGLTVTNELQLEYRDWLNKRTGQVQRVPVGIDPGFDYNPGLAARGVELPGDLEPLDEPTEFAEPKAVKAPKPLKGKARKQLEKEFAKLFGVQLGHAGRVKDPLGYVVEFPIALLDHLDEETARRLPWAVHAIEQPHEIWLTPYRRQDGGVLVRRRYLLLTREATLVVIPGGWFEVHPPGQIEVERRGWLHYEAE